MKFDLVVNEVINSKDINIRIQNLYYFLEYYFSNDRPQILERYQYKIIKVLPEIMEGMSFNHLNLIIPDFYQFCYTTQKDIFITANQKRISRTILVPFANALKNKIKSMNVTSVHYELLEDHYLIYCRHATSQGPYAPGKQIYTMVHALLKSNKFVTIYCRGHADKAFEDLKKRYKKFSIIIKDPIIKMEEEFIELIEICKKFKPIKIITEIPMGISSAIFFCGISSKMLFWVAGFHQVPWFDYKLLIPEVYSNEHENLPEYIKIPHSLDLELLNPIIENTLINKVKINKLKLNHNNFVIGTFARYEKFSKPFLELVLKILAKNSNIKIILAGPNDQTLARQILDVQVKKEQAFIFGVSNVHILGNCCDVFLDTFPIPCGYSAFEIMAKGKPVVGLKSKNLRNYINARMPELMFENQKDIEKCIKKLEKNKLFYKTASDKYKKIATDLDDWSNLAQKIISI